MAGFSFTRAEIHRRYAEGLTPSALIVDVFARIATVDDPGIFIHLAPEADVIAFAEALPAFDPERFPLWGLPFAIKDNIDVAGMPTTAGCPAYAYVPSRHAMVVELLIAAGAIPIGKANLDQFATGLVGVRTPYPIPRNPFDPGRVPGGSSSGSAVAVANGLVSFALGTDTAGSGRIPAAFSNLVGLKPSLGALSTRGVVPACRTLDCVSIFALDVATARAVFESAADYDAADPYSRPVAARKTAIRKVAIPRPDDLRFPGDAAMAGAWQAAAARLGGLGLDVSEIDMTPFFEVAKMLYDGPWVAERRAAVGRFMDDRPDAMHPVTRSILAGADRHNAVDTFRAFYRLADLRQACDAALASFDALIVPSAPIFPTLAQLEADPIGPNTLLGTYTNFVNLLDLAAVAAPGPLRADGLPSGVTVIARSGSDAILCDLAGRFFPGTGGYAATLAEAA